MQSQKDNTEQVKGLTLVEMVIAISIMAIVFTAMMPLLASVRTNWSTRQANTEIIQNARILTDHLGRTLAGAVQITDVSSPSEPKGRISFVASDGDEYRYAVADDGYVQFGPQSAVPGDLAGPVTEFRMTCYDGNDFVTPTNDPAAIRFVTIDMNFSNPSDLGEDKPFTASVYLRPEATPGANPGMVEPGVAVRDSIEWAGQGTVIDSYRSSQGPYIPATPGGEAVVSVNATGYGVIALWTQTRIRGDAYIGPGGDVHLGIQLAGGSEITGKQGTLSHLVSMSVASAPSGLPFDGPREGSLTLSGTNTETVDTNRHVDRIELEGDSKLIVDGHVTVLLDGAFQMEDRAEVRIQPDSSLTLYAKRGLTISGSAKLNDSTKDPSRLRIYMIGNNKDLEMSGSATMHGVLDNPSGGVSIWSGARFFGKIKAATLEGGGQIHVDLDCHFDSSED